MVWSSDNKCSAVQQEQTFCSFCDKRLEQIRLIASSCFTVCQHIKTTEELHEIRLILLRLSFAEVWMEIFQFQSKSDKSKN